MNQITQDAVGFGAGSLDKFRPMGVVGTDYVQGAKIAMTAEEEAALQHQQFTDRIGGNVVNTLAFLAVNTPHDVRFAGVVGTEDEASVAIRDHLPLVGIQDHAITVPGYLPSISIIERLAPGVDRMVRGRPRHPQSEHISDEYITEHTRSAGIVVAASLKDLDLTRRIFDATPEGTFLSYNPGSSEVKTTAEGLTAILRDRPPTLLALNDEELRALYGEPDIDIRKLASRATELSRYVLCTLGKDGSLLASNGMVEHGAAHLVETEKVVDTLGAGDRAHAVAILGLVQGSSPDKILYEVAEQTAIVVQHVGAHGDLHLRS